LTLSKVGSDIGIVSVCRRLVKGPVYNQHVRAPALQNRTW